MCHLLSEPASNPLLPSPPLNHATSSMFRAHTIHVATADSLAPGFLDVQGGSSLTVTSLDAQYFIRDFIQPKNYC